MDYIAYCGINCNACSFKVSCQEQDIRHLMDMPEKYKDLKQDDILEDAPCPGCRYHSQCGDCKMKDCITDKNSGQDLVLLHCGECEEFPCELILEFSNDGVPHHHEAVKNLEYIRQNGMEQFLQRESVRWICSQCGKKLSWYLTDCPDCGEMK